MIKKVVLNKKKNNQFLKSKKKKLMLNNKKSHSLQFKRFVQNKFQPRNKNLKMPKYKGKTEILKNKKIKKMILKIKFNIIFGNK